jgi:hypothetical protein
MKLQRMLTFNVTNSKLRLLGFDTVILLKEKHNVMQ